MILRKIRKNKVLFAINLTGLSIALTCVLLITLYAKKELSYDRFHSKADRIYRVTLETKSEGNAVSIHPARVAGDWTDELVKDYPQIEKLTKFSPYRNAIVKIDKNIFYSSRAFSADSCFFDIFDFKLINGNRNEILTQPNTALISKSIALKYFGTTEAIGKTINIMHQLENQGEDFTIVGVMEDFPENSHFFMDILTSEKKLQNRTNWLYTYLLAKPETNMQTIASNIQEEWDKENKSKLYRKIHFQKLTEIHLHSKKPRELEANGSLRSVILLLSGALIILFIAIINFYNLSRVQFIAELKNVKVKIINGASKWDIVFEKIKETLPLLIASIVISILIVYTAFNFANKNIWKVLQNEWFLTIITLALFAVLIIVTNLFSINLPKITAEKQTITKSHYGYKLPLIAQLILSIITISGAFILHKQMNFINNLHPIADDANMLIIPNVPMEATHKYPLLKQELMQNTNIKNVTAAMEKPGGNILDNFNFELEGLENNESRSIKILTVAPNFFDVMKINPIAGNTDLNKSTLPDWEQKAIKVSIAKMENQTIDKEIEEKVLSYNETYVINESAMKMLGFHNPKNVVGKKFMLKYNLQELFPKGKIIGVVPDFHYTNLFSKEEPMVIVAKQLFSKWFIIELNTNDRNKTLAEINNIWTNIYPDYPFSYEFITDNYETIYKGEYTQTKVLSLFAIISILLSSIGILALTRFSIQRRTKEIGIRKINGATINEILILLNKGFVKWVIVAFVIATPIAYYAMNKWLENFAYKTTLNWWIFAFSGLSALLIALLTVSLQSYRAASRNPVEALRYE